MIGKRSEKNGGFVLVLVLLVLAVLLAMAVDFAYGVYVNVSGLHNLDTLQTLSTEGSSLIDSSANVFLQALAQGGIPLDGEDMTLPVDDGTTVHFVAVDENGKFNLNTLVQPNGDLNKDAYQSFKRLLKALNMDETIADKVVYWINPAAV
ncbi:MAG: type II secretion system protein GspK, partial [Nitrospiraceae bacterium]|nr:type II secretion system protein GspK [Nitrospiraceae bacterium]